MIFYPENVFNEEEEYVGQGYVDGETRIVAYKRDGYIYVYEGNDILMAKYPANSFTVMEAMYLAIAGCFYAENAGDIREDILDRLDDIYLTKVDIPENSQWTYRMEGEYYDL